MYGRIIESRRGTTKTAPQKHTNGQIGDFPRRPFESICIDAIHIRPYLALVSVDHFSGFTSAYAIDNERIETLINATLSLCLRFIVPKMIRLDNHRSFKSTKFIDAMNKMDITLSFTTPANSQANGACERRIRQVQERLKTLTMNNVVNGSESMTIMDLQTCIDLIVFEINMSPRNNKICPLMIMTGIEPSFQIHTPHILKESEEPHGQRLTDLRNEIQARIAKDYENEASAEITPSQEMKLKVGDFVRIQKASVATKTKREQTRYSKEIYQIKEILNRYGTVKIMEVKETDKIDRRRPEIRIISVKKLKRIIDRSKLIETYEKKTQKEWAKDCEVPKEVGHKSTSPKKWAEEVKVPRSGQKSPKKWAVEV